MLRRAASLATTTDVIALQKLVVLERLVTESAIFARIASKCSLHLFRYPEIINFKFQYANLVLPPIVRNGGSFACKLDGRIAVGVRRSLERI